MHRLIRSSCALSLTLWSVSAFSGTDESCFAAAAEGQKLEKAGKLLESQLRYSECAKAECPAEVTSTCTGFLRRAEEATPSILIDLKTADGKDVAEATTGTVAIDGRTIPEALGSSKPLRIDPGPHEIRVVVGSFSETRKVIVREHEKGIVVRFVERDSASGVVVAKPSGGIPAGALVAGGVAVVGLGVFAIVGILGVSDRADAGCEIGCGTNDYDRIQTKFLVADVALGVGIAGALVAGAFLLFGKRGDESAAKSALRFMPLVRF